MRRAAHPALIGCAIKQFEHQRAHRIDPRIARTDKRDVVPLARLLQRISAARLLAAQREIPARLAGGERPQEIDVESVAHQLVGLGNEPARLRRAPCGLPGADAHQRKPPARAPGVGGDRRGRTGKRRRAIGALVLFHHQCAFRPHRRQRRAFGDTGAADFGAHDLGWIGEARLLSRKLLRAKQPERHAKAARQFVHRRLVGLQIERVDARHRPRRNTGFVKHGPDQFLKFRRIRIARAPNPKGKPLRMIDKPCLASRHRRRGNMDFHHAAGILGQIEKPLSHLPHASTRKQGRHNGLCVFRIGQAVASGRFVKRHAKRHVARGGDGRLAIQCFCRAPRQPVRAPVPPQKRHHHRAIIGNGDERRLAALVRKQRCHGTDQDCARAYPDHRHAGGEKFAHMLKRIGKEGIGPRHPPCAPMHSCAKSRSQYLRHLLARARKTDDNRI